MDKKIIGVIAVVIIIAVSLVGFNYFSGPTYQEMRNETIDGITVTIPKDANLTKSGFSDNREDMKLGVQFAPLNSIESLTIFVSVLEGRKDMQRTTLDERPAGAMAWKSDAGWTQILVVNEDGTKGICVGAKDGRLALFMANSVKF